MCNSCYPLALQERNKEYSVKQGTRTATQSMLKLAWDIQELATINDMSRSILVECQVLVEKLNDPVYDTVEDNLARRLTSLRGQMTTFVKRASRYRRNPAGHLLVIMISTEDRKRKPYAMPVQCIAYRSLKDAKIRCIANKVVQEMTQRGMKVAGMPYAIYHILYASIYNASQICRIYHKWRME